MKRAYFIIAFLLFLCQQSFTQEKPGARQIALCHSGVAMESDAFSVFNNPAGLTTITSNMAAVFYSPSPFGVNQLSNAYASYVTKNSFGTISSGFMIYGFELYKETIISVGIGKLITDNFSIGFTTEFKNISIKNYGTKGFMIFNCGGLAKLSDEINFGFTVNNITRTTINGHENQIPIIYSTGLCYKVSDELQIFSALIKELGYDVSFRAGAEFSIINCLQVRLGISSDPKIYSGGIGVSFYGFQFNYAVTSHPLLDYTHQFGLVISF